MACHCRRPPCNCAVTEACPFVLNLERYHNNQGYDQWPGGFYLEVLVHATPDHPFWQSDLLVVMDFSSVRAQHERENRRE